MNTEEFNKVANSIDQLVKMSGSKDDPSTLDIELSSIEQEISQVRESLDNLESLISPERYYNANEAITNNIVESSLVRRNNSLELDIRTKRNKIAKMEKELEALTKSLEENSKNITRSEKCISTLQRRLEENTTLDKHTQKHYQSLIDKTSRSLDVFRSEAEQYDSERISIRTKISEIENEIALLQNVIDTNNAYLHSARNSRLETEQEESDLKNRDEKEVSALKEKLSELESKRLEILSNPILLATKARSALDENNAPLALSYIKELAASVSTKEYMDIPYDENFESTIKSLLEQAETARNEFASLIESKNYHSDNTELDLKRKAHLEERIIFYNETIATIKKLVSQIDTRNSLNNNNVEQVEGSIRTMESDLESYSKSDIKASLKDAEIIAASNRKKNQIDGAKGLIAAYEQDVITDIDIANSLESNMISSLEIAISNAKRELSAIENRLSLQKTTQEDFVAKAIDEAKLKELANNVINIKYRKKFKESPAQILANVESRLAVEETVDPVLAPVEEAPLVTEPTEISVAEEPSLKIDHIIDLAEENYDYKPLDSDEKTDVDDYRIEPEEPVEEVQQEETPLEPKIPQEEAEPADEEVPVIEEPALDTDEKANDETVLPSIEPTELVSLPDESVLGVEEAEISEEKRGSKVIDITPIEITEPEITVEDVVEQPPVENDYEEVAVALEEPVVVNDNPFLSDSNIFDFNGDLLNTDEDPTEIIDFSSSDDDMALNLGKAA